MTSFSHQTVDRVKAAIRQLADDPRPRGSRKLRRELGHRIRVGDYRIVYVVSDQTHQVTINAVRHRREAYR